MFRLQKNALVMNNQYTKLCIDAVSIIFWVFSTQSWQARLLFFFIALMTFYDYSTAFLLIYVTYCDASWKAFKTMIFCRIAPLLVHLCSIIPKQTSLIRNFNPVSRSVLYPVVDKLICWLNRLAVWCHNSNYKIQVLETGFKVTVWGLSSKTLLFDTPSTFSLLSELMFCVPYWKAQWKRAHSYSLMSILPGVVLGGAVSRFIAGTLLYPADVYCDDESWAQKTPLMPWWLLCLFWVSVLATYMQIKYCGCMWEKGTERILQVHHKVLLRRQCCVKWDHRAYSLCRGFLL